MLLAGLAALVGAACSQPVTPEVPAETATAPTAMPTLEATAAAQPAATAMPTPAARAVPTPTATATPMPTPMPQPTPTGTPAPTPTPTLVPTPAPLATPVPTPALTPAPLAPVLAVPLAGAAREARPLFSPENEGVVREVLGLVRRQNSFVPNFHRQLAREEEGNLFWSPYSLYLDMGVVYAGAGAGTAEDFEKALNSGTSPLQFHRNLNSLDLTLRQDSAKPGAAADSRPTLSVANGLWIQDGLEVQPEFINTVTANYGVGPGLSHMDFKRPIDG